MDYTRIEATEIFKNEHEELNRTKSVFQQNVAIHVDDEAEMNRTMPPVFRNENKTVQKVKAENKKPEEEYDIPKLEEVKQDNNLLVSREMQLEAEKETEKTTEKNMVPLNLQKSEINHGTEGKKVAYIALKPGEALEKYITEVKNKRQSEQGNEELNQAVILSDKCRSMLSDGYGKEVGTERLQSCLGQLNEAILQIDRYIKKSKHITRGKGTIERNAEERALRESAKMLRIQLFLEKMELYERIEAESEKSNDEKDEKIDERKLYQQQLEEDARVQIYNEYKKNNIDEVVETSKTAISKTKMEQKKSEQLLIEDNRQIAKYARKISDSEGRARELQEKIQKNGYDVRHKQFLRSEVYQQKVSEKIEELRPLVLEEWLEDNFSCIKENGEKLKAFFEEKGLQSKKIKGIRMNEMGSLFQAEIKNDESLEGIAQRYDALFRKMENLSPSTWPSFPREIKNLVAAQIVLFEKRQLLKKEYSQVGGKTEVAPKYNIPKAPALKYNIPKAPALKYNIPKAPAWTRKEEQQVALYGSQAEREKKLQTEGLKGMRLLGDGSENMALTAYRFSNNNQELVKLAESVELVDLQNISTENNTDYAEKFLKKIDASYEGATVTEITEEGYLAEQNKNENQEETEHFTKYKALQAGMTNSKELLEKQADREYVRMMQELEAYLQNLSIVTEEQSSQSTALVSKKSLMDAVKEYIVSVVGKTPVLAENSPVTFKVAANTGSKQKKDRIWNVIAIKWKSVRPAKAIYKMLGDGTNNVTETLNQKMPELPSDPNEQELMKYSIEDLLREAHLSRERQEQSEQTEKEKELLEQKKKAEDLEFQKVNNEYGLQGMASEEKEREDNKREKELKEQKAAEEKAAETIETRSPEVVLERIMASEDIHSKETDEPTTIIRKENNKLVIAFMGRYDEMKELIRTNAEERDREGYQFYIDEIKRVFFEKYFENEKQYLEEEQNYDSDKVGDIVREMTEFYGDRMLELQALYEPLLNMSGQ